MADNTVINPGLSGDTIRDKDRSGVKTQVVGTDLAPGGSTEVLAGTVTSGSLSVYSGFGPIALGAFSSSSPAASSSITANTAGCGTAAFGFNNTNFVGVLTFEATVDGTNWFQVSILPQGQDAWVQSMGLGSGAHFAGRIGCLSYQQVRMRVSTLTSGAGTGYIVPTVPAFSPSLSTTGSVSTGAVSRLGMGHTATRSSVASSASLTTLLNGNANRIGATIFNESTAVLYLILGSGGSTTDYTVQVASNSPYQIPFGYDGQIGGVWASANGNARITELT